MSDNIAGFFFGILPSVLPLYQNVPKIFFIEQGDQLHSYY